MGRKRRLKAWVLGWSWNPAKQPRTSWREAWGGVRIKGDVTVRHSHPPASLRRVAASSISFEATPDEHDSRPRVISILKFSIEQFIMGSVRRVFAAFLPFLALGSL